MQDLTPSWAFLPAVPPRSPETPCSGSASPDSRRALFRQPRSIARHHQQVVRTLLDEEKGHIRLLWKLKQELGQ
jgi:hypothetical protein